ncbi:MAG: 16S rRNA (adenine(1518)-N(6)/adenine(1519)-N(6))-dimethyltransferase RsmA [Gammaproteobacteria bacterium]|jgi:16S rRNA (adenine1518-N6/adenine1519-N6)-dimethyltransferase|nr:16S rRNA (adenine(1518)-N(6)/adenine(1519)-N(6))-dimethyltransferase RsmA [Gammaproteobacteria bacterium]MBT7308156.1 16S rRNA (adenine(1518)-N(6)/adenine(1519)-N(6))-dimethyltransferase RsmA [Gammaproteobacteria bacterium]
MNHTPRKRFGQNFLHDQNVIQKIVSAIRLRKEDLLIEIGPGEGALTCQLLPQLSAMHAIELDRDLIPQLQQRCSSIGNLTLHNADVLKFDFSAIDEPDRPLRVVGNLPYNISTPLIFHLLQHQTRIQDMHFLLQKEVVDRLAAAPNSRTYGRLSVMIQRYCRVEPLFTIGPGAFNPPPKVNSSVVRLTPWKIAPVAIEDESHFSQLVAAAFSQRRKTVRNSLKGWVTPEQFEAAGVDPGCRAETVALEGFAALSNQSRPQ